MTPPTGPPGFVLPAPGLDTAYAERERSSFLDGVKVTAAFAPLHPYPRWSRLLSEMGSSPVKSVRQ